MYNEHSTASSSPQQLPQVHRSLEVLKVAVLEQKDMSKSCKGLALELVKCLSESPCMKDQHRSYKECAGEKVPQIASECVGLRETYFQCKRGQVWICPHDQVYRVENHQSNPSLKYSLRIWQNNAYLLKVRT